MNPLVLLNKIILQTDGRDKVLKIVQYTTRLLLWRISTSEKSGAHDDDGQYALRLDRLVRQFSITRHAHYYLSISYSCDSCSKIIRLLHFIEPVQECVSFLTKVTNGPTAGPATGASGGFESLFN